MIFMAMAGYNPQEAINAQQRMMQLGGSQGAEILSSHPSTQNRIEELKDFYQELWNTIRNKMNCTYYLKSKI